MSAFDFIGEKFASKDYLAELASRSTAVLEAQQSIAIPSESSFLVPTLKLLSDPDRDAWIDRLAHGAPLSELVHSVPNGFQRGRVLDIIYQKAVPIHRALWLIKLLGVTELGISAGSVNAQFSYSIDWTELVLKFLHLRFAELVAAAQLEPTSEERDLYHRRSLLAGWKYCIELCGLQYQEGLLDQRIFLSKALDIFKNVPISQVGFAIPLIAMLMHDFGRSRALMRQFVFSAVKKLDQVQSINSDIAAVLFVSCINWRLYYSDYRSSGMAY